MKHIEGYYDGLRGQRIYHQAWLPEDDPKAILILVHGLAEHSGRYGRLVTHLVERGYAVFGLDHIGHGRSEGRRVFVRAFSDLTTVLGNHIHRVIEEHPAQPRFLYGHSVGALIAAVMQIEDPIEWKGIIFSGPCVKVPANVSTTTVVLAKALSRIAPGLGLSSVDVRGVSSDPAEVQAYIADPYVYNGKTTARLGCELLHAMKRVSQGAEAIRQPALIVQGSEDVIVDPAGASWLHSSIRSTDKTLKVYDGLYHELHNEPQHTQVLADIGDWLDARV